MYPDNWSVDRHFVRLVQVIKRQYRLPWYGTHGVTHWGRVLENGLRLAQVTGADPQVVALFAIFHDAQRISEGWDRGHGKRGADLAAGLLDEFFNLSQTQFDLLYQACCLHTDGLIEGDVTLQTCWDADRLDLARVHIMPSAERLCTEAARQSEMIIWAVERAEQRLVPKVVDLWDLEISLEDV